MNPPLLCSNGACLGICPSSFESIQLRFEMACGVFYASSKSEKVRMVDPEYIRWGFCAAAGNTLDYIRKTFGAQIGVFSEVSAGVPQYQRETLSRFHGSAAMPDDLYL